MANVSLCVPCLSLCDTLASRVALSDTQDEYGSHTCDAGMCISLVVLPDSALRQTDAINTTTRSQ